MAAAAPTKDIRICLGHGTENNIRFIHRHKLKKGYTLITFTSHGLIMNLNEKICELNDIFSREGNRKLLKNPDDTLKEKFKEKGILDTRIYYSGDKIPDLYLSFPLYWKRNAHNDTAFKQEFDDKGEPNVTGIICKSGIIDFPIPSFNITSLGYNSTIGICKNRCIVTKNNLTKHQEQHIIVDSLINNIYKPVDNKEQYPLEKIMYECGPGVYYYPVCRYLHGTNIRTTDINYPMNALIEETRLLSNEQQTSSKDHPMGRIEYMDTDHPMGRIEYMDTYHPMGRDKKPKTKTKTKTKPKTKTKTKTKPKTRKRKRTRTINIFRKQKPTNPRFKKRTRKRRTKTRK